MNKPELLAPAGNFDKMKIAFLYGADAVYLSGNSFGLRSASNNFSFNELRSAIDYAHNRGKKIYLVVNTLPHNKEMNYVIDYFNKISIINIDALIISDPGVLKLANKYTNFKIHLSTQASCVNYESANFWKNAGVSRIIIGREASLKDSYEIADKTDIEVEIFIHGSMCVSYSGKCVASNYTSLRDANRGGCVQCCRWEYIIEGFEDKGGIYLLNSRDLCGIEEIYDIVKNNKIRSLKIEGRMKNYLYIAHTVATYRKAIDFCYEKLKTMMVSANPKKEYEKILPKLKKTLESGINRTITKAFFHKTAGAESILYNNITNNVEYENIGIIIEKISDSLLVVDIKNILQIGDNIDIFISFDYSINRKIILIKNLFGEDIDYINNNRIAYIIIDEPINIDLKEYFVIRKLLTTGHQPLLPRLDSLEKS